MRRAHRKGVGIFFCTIQIVYTGNRGTERRSPFGLPILQGSAAGFGNRAAHKAFRDHHPKSRRALFGLWESLKAQGRDADEASVRTEFEKLWEIADVELTLGSL